MNAPPVLQQRRDNWWSRNWKWFVPTLCVGVVLAFTAFVAVIVGIVFGAMKSSEAYKRAVATAKADARVANALGSPLKEGSFVSGSIRVNGPSGTANLAIPISGPKGKGIIYVVATKSAGKWTFSKLMVELKDRSETIDLRQGRANEQDLVKKPD